MYSPDTFNARWVSPENVAETFVPIPQFRQLLHNSHSLLLGPRGCGKTTLLKMLTRQAQTKWLSSGRGARFDVQFQPPGFEAVYIPSDVRWSYEVRSIPDSITSNSDLVKRAQRVMVAANAIYHFVGTLRELVSTDRGLERSVCEQLIRRLALKETLPTVRDVRCSLEDLTGTVRGTVSAGNVLSLETVLARVPAFLYGHVLDSIASVLHIVSEYLDEKTKPNQWALCFDELEIAPEWLRGELVESLRSGPQDVLLKLTWHPILPSGIPTSPGAANDFRPIRLWHSHIEDPKQFCEDLTTDFLRRKFGKEAPSPSDVFSRSVLASEAEDEPPKAYERDSTEYIAFRDLAAWDRAFASVLADRKIDPQDPVPKNQAEKDRFFRKVKPIVLLRHVFSDETKNRSRKAPALYVGREAIYAMSEGNPRWLLSLLTDLIDLGEPRQSGQAAVSVSYQSQGRLLASASIRLRSLIKASPFRPPANTLSAADYTLLGFVEELGNYFRESIYNKDDFREDPLGSFECPESIDDVYLAMITQLLENGALVYVGSTHQDVPTAIGGSRFRLSFMLAPIFKLPFRNFKAVSLSEILGHPHDTKQLQLPINL